MKNVSQHVSQTGDLWGKRSNSTEFSTDDYLTRANNGELLGRRMAVFAAWIAFPVWTVRVTFASLLGRWMMTTFCSKELKTDVTTTSSKEGVQWWALCKGEAGKMVEFCPYFYIGLMSLVWLPRCDASQYQWQVNSLVAGTPTYPNWWRSFSDGNLESWDFFEQTSFPGVHVDVASHLEDLCHEHWRFIVQPVFVISWISGSLSTLNPW